MSIALEGIKEDGYRLGDYQAIRYDRESSLFGDSYLSRLYGLCRDAKRRSGDGILTTIFGGNPPSNFDAIVSYLAARPVIVMGEWVEGEFREAGFTFPLITCGAPGIPEKAIFAGYGFFPHVWGTPELPVMAMLGLCYLFQEFDVKAIHGTRYEENALTWRFTQQFGFKETGRVPYYQLKNGKLVDGIVTTLLRVDFEQYVEQFLVEQYRAEGEPVVEESRATIEAQMARLVAGEIPVVFFPSGSSYVPPMPESFAGRMEVDCPGAGVYYFNPAMLTHAQVQKAAAEGTHGEFLGHVQNKVEAIVAGRTCVVQALAPDGTVLQDSVVSDRPEAIRAQIASFKARFADCHCAVVSAKKALGDRKVSPQKA